MTEPFDLDAAVSEAVGEPFRFTWGGQQFELPPILDMDLERQLQIVDAIEALDMKTADSVAVLSTVKLIVGDDLLDRMRAARPLGGPALMTLVRRWIDHQGGALGKSADPVPSLNGTAPRSKPTSRSTRARRTS